VYSKFGTVIAIMLALFPFAATLIKLAQTEMSVTVIVVAAIFVVLFAVVLTQCALRSSPSPR